MVDVDGWVFRDIVCVVNNYRDFEARSYTDTGTNVRRADDCRTVFRSLWRDRRTGAAVEAMRSTG